MRFSVGRVILLSVMSKTKITFVPQAWIGDYAYQVDPLGPTTFEVDSSEVAGMEPDSYESDELKDHPNCPSWIKDWFGPFYFTWEID